MHACMDARTHIRTCTHIRMYARTHVCTYAHTHVHVRTHAHTDARTHIRMYACTHLCMLACTHVCTYARTHVCRHICTYTCTLVCTYTRTDACTHVCTCTRTHVHTHARTTHTHAHMYAHAHARTYTRMHILTARRLGGATRGYAGLRGVTRGYAGLCRRVRRRVAARMPDSTWRACALDVKARRAPLASAGTTCECKILMTNISESASWGRAHRALRERCALLALGLAPAGSHGRLRQRGYATPAKSARPTFG